MRLLRAALAALTAGLVAAALGQQPATITILHTNDLHAHVEGKVISRVPYGGYARQATLIQRFRESDPNVILLNAGDTFQGTLYFNTYEGLADLAFMNAVRYDAMTVGNHEFDNGPEQLGRFAQFATFPLLAANLDVSAEPALAGRIHPSTVITVGGHRVGVVGAITNETPNIAAPGPSVRFLDQRESVQRAVDALTAQGVNKIVLLTHNGFTEDLELARKIRDVDVIVGGHSHTALGTPALPGWPEARGAYPTWTTDAAGSRVAVVQAFHWGLVLGRLQAHFDADGKITSVTEAAPVLIDGTIPEDPLVASMLAAFRKPIDALAKQPIGEAAANIERGRGENAVANLITDAMLAATERQGAVAAFMNSGGVRASIGEGTVTYGTAIEVQPFGNTLVIVEITGAELKTVLEEGVPEPDRLGGLLHPSRGSSYRVDLSRPAGSRVSDVQIAGRPLELGTTYLIAFNNFTASGGDSHFALKAVPGKRIETGIVDLDALIEHIKRTSPLQPILEGRLAVRG
jgi:5'-nucleotidase / UDP-sugar diphosphatase